MKSTMKTLILFLCFGAMSAVAWGQDCPAPTDPEQLPNHYFRSYYTGKAGPWDDPNTWEEYHPETHQFCPAERKPDNTFQDIIVHHYSSSGESDTVIVNTTEYADQLVVEGVLIIKGPSGRLIITDDGYPGRYDLTVWGKLKIENGGRLELQPGTSAHIRSGGSFIILEKSPLAYSALSSSGSINNLGDIFIEGTFEFAGGSVTGKPFRYGANGNLRLTDPAGNVIDSGNIFWPTTNGPANVTMSSNVMLNGTRTIRGLLAISKTLQIDSTGALITQGTTTVSGTLNVLGMYTNTGTLQVSTSGAINNLGDILIEGSFNPLSGSVTGNPLRYGANGSLQLTSYLPGYVIDNDNLFWPIANGPANVSITEKVTLNGTRTVTGLLKVGLLQITSIGALTTRGTTEVSGILHVVGIYTNTGTLKVPGTLQVNGTFTNNGTTQIAGTFQINPGGAVDGNAFVYIGCCSKLVFKDSYSIDSGNIFWPSANGPANVIVPSAFSITLNAARTISASLDVSGTLQVADTLTINGATYVPGTLEVTGKLISNGTATVYGTVHVAGTGTLINNVAAVIYNVLRVSGTLINTGTIQAYRAFQVTGTLTNNGTAQIIGECQLAGTFSNNGSTQIDGTFQLNQGGAVTGNEFIYDIGGRLIFNHSSGSYSVNSVDIIWPSTNSPARVIVQGPGGLTMNAARTVQDFDTAAGVTNADSLTISGIVAINAGGSFDSSPIYNGEATLVYGANGSYDVGTEWISGDSVGSGVPMNVVISAGATVNMPDSARTCLGYISISGTLVLSTTPGADLSVGGDWRNDLYNPGTLTPNSRAVIFNGTAEQILEGVTAFDDLTVNNPAGISVPGFDNSEEQHLYSVTVHQALTFIAGNIRLGQNFEAYLILPGSVSGAANGRHVVTYENGLVVRAIAGGGSFQFPIGPTETSYNPVMIALHPADPEETFSVRVDSTINLGALGDSLFVQRTWDISESFSGDNNAALTFQWAGAEEGEKFTRNNSSTYLDNVEIVQNGVASGMDPYIVSTRGGFLCTEFSLYTVGTSGNLTAAEESKNEIPASYMLGQNYPNPFWSGATSRFAGNPATTIRYAIPKASNVILKVYDLFGKEIETLTSERQSAGEHRIQWNPVGVPSGVYFYRLQAGEFVATKKLILMK